MSTSTILEEVHSFIREQELNLSQFSMRLNINAGTLSYILNGNRALTIEHLDRISEIMGVPIGHYYENYIEDYLQERNPNWRRVGPFLRKCAELDKLDCIRRTVCLLLDNLSYSTSLFELAEEFFEKGFYGAAEILYENVAMCETRQYSERLAICQYRLFKIRIGSDQANNLKIAHQFEPYVDRLDEVLQLDALKDLANLYRSLREWDRLEVLALEMERKARLLYFSTRRSDKQFYERQHRLSRPMFVYIVYAKLLCAEVYEGREDYAKALEYTYQYTNLSWVQEKDEDSIHWLRLFQKWSSANIYVNRLMSGEIEYLPDYVAFMIENPDEVISSISNVMSAANRHQIDVDHILLQFKSEIEAYINRKQSNDLYKDQVLPDKYNQFLYDLTYYYLHKKEYTMGFNYLMQGIENSVKMNNKEALLDFMVLFEHHRHMAAIDICKKYKNIVSEVKRSL
ncbi:MAG: helix-turn-helix transcriptional regulator [Paenibacillus sp.]|uniref:helix-turn-helix domain-containing protein n=1 Tax=Paenibacillus sp. TaxID=58172 RepID=UPI002912F478|nr:helix-turn-helix transcriptional regulator [Paenibacillus sp.]MDU4696294.1 helix-turn-helix transcriptional regulator [Paenibacillus sp.]